MKLSDPLFTIQFLARGDWSRTMWPAGARSLYYTSPAAPQPRSDGPMSAQATGLGQLGHDDTEPQRGALTDGVVANPTDCAPLGLGYSRAHLLP